MKTTQYIRQEKAIAVFDTTWYVEQELRIQEADVRDALARRRRRVEFDEGYVYVVEFDSGVIKVGKARNAKSRLAAHARSGLIRSSWTSPCHLHCGKTEALLISFCAERGELHGGREYFRGLDFDAVRLVAERLADEARAAA